MSRPQTLETVIKPEDLVVYKCANNEALALKPIWQIEKNERKKQSREEKYKQFGGAAFHILFRPNAADISSAVQEILDAEDLEKLSHPFDYANTEQIRYHKGANLSEDSLTRAMEKLKENCKDSAYLKLELTFHSNLFLNRANNNGLLGNRIDKDSIKNLTSKIQSAINDPSLRLQAVEVKLNSCNSSGNIAEIFFQNLNGQNKTPVSVKSSPGIVYIEMYDALLLLDDHNKLSRDPKVKSLKPQEYVKFGALTQDAKTVLEGLCDRNFVSKHLSSKNGVHIPLMIDRYAIIGSGSHESTTETVSKNVPFAGGEKPLFSILKSHGQLIPEEQKRSSERIGTKINPEIAYNNFLKKHPDYLNIEEEMKKLLTEAKSSGFSTITTSISADGVNCTTEVEQNSQNIKGINLKITQSKDNTTIIHELSFDGENLHFDHKNSPLQTLRSMFANGGLSDSISKANATKMVVTAKQPSP